MSGENGKAELNKTIVNGEKVSGGEIIPSACPKIGCPSSVQIVPAEHLYGSPRHEDKLNKCMTGHPFLIYYRPGTDTYLLEAVENA